MVRGAHLAGIRTGSFDILVIGGGITGAGVALDAAARGLSVALVERGDFVSGTSSWSTKLVHGGVRYMPMFDIAQVRLSGLYSACLTLDPFGTRLRRHAIEQDRVNGTIDAGVLGSSTGPPEHDDSFGRKPAPGP